MLRNIFPLAHLFAPVFMYLFIKVYYKLLLWVTNLGHFHRFLDWKLMAESPGG
jgi:hypothetical protein